MNSPNIHLVSDFCEECNEETTHVIIFDSLVPHTKKVYFLQYCNTCMQKFGENTMVSKMETTITAWKKFLLEYHKNEN